MYVYTGILKPGTKTRHGQFLCTADFLTIKLSYVQASLNFLVKGVAGFSRGQNYTPCVADN